MIAFIYLLLVLEETNSARTIITGQDNKNASGSQTPVELVLEAASSEKQGSTVAPSPESSEEEVGQVTRPTKAYWQKMRLFEPGAFSKPDRLRRMVVRPLISLTFPIIAYSGFCYGSNLVWFNVLNGTASLILSGEPYSLPASIVGVSDISPLIGVFLGSASSGKFGDWFMVRMSRTKRWIHRARAPSVALLCVASLGTFRPDLVVVSLLPNMFTGLVSSLSCV